MNPRLDIVHINTQDRVGGAANVAWRLAEAQRAAGHRSRLIVGNRESDSADSIRFDAEPDPRLAAVCGREGYLSYEFQGSHRLVNHPALRSADLVHFHNLHGQYFNPFSVAALSRLKPVVWTLHDMQAFTGHCAHSFACERWQGGCGSCPNLQVYPAIAKDSTARLWDDKRSIYRNSRLHVVVPSRWLLEKVARSILSEHPVDIVHNGIDTGLFRPFGRREVRDALGIPEGTLVIGAAAHGGTIRNPWKGGQYTRTVLEALGGTSLDFLFLDIGGDAPALSCRSMGTGYIHDEKMLAMVYSALDVFLYTPEADNCPLVVLEALACGVPMVSFDVGGIPELVRDRQDGFLVRKGDLEATGRAVIELATDGELRRRIGESARRSAVERFDHALVADRYERIYRATIDECERRPAPRPFRLEEVPEIVRTEAFLAAESGDDAGRASGEAAPKVTVIVSAYNSEAFMAECLDDLARQTIADVSEVIVVDAASPQDEGRIVLERQAGFPGLLYVRTPARIGVYAAWNLALKLARGEYVTVFSTNDRLRKDAHEILARTLDRNPEVGLVYGDSIITHTPHETFERHTPVGAFRWPEYSFEDLLNNCRVGPHPMWRRSVHAVVGEFDERYAALGDQDFFIRVAERYPLLHIPEPTGLYWMSPEGLSNQADVTTPELAEIRAKYRARHAAAIPAAPKRAMPSYRELCEAYAGQGVRKAAPPKAGRPRTAPGASPRISVVTPSFNQAAYIGQTIESVLSQRYPDFEHIVVDGGSTDGTLEILKRYPHLKWISEADRGQADALNKGFRMATGDVIAWVNSDDWYEPGAFDAVAAFFRDNPDEDVVMGDCLLVDENGKVFDKVVNVERGFEEIRCHWVPRSIPTQPAVFFRKRLLDECGELDVSLHYVMDFDLWLRFSQKARFRHIDVTTSGYRFHAGAKGGDQDWSKFVPECRVVYDRYRPSPRVSVVIPCYNYGRFLEGAVGSVLAQDFRPLEILVVDDGSTDDTAQVTRRIIEANPGVEIRLLTQPNSGDPARPRNRGIAEARGEYVICLDPDDYLAPDMISECVAALDADPGAGIAYPNQVHFGPDRNYVPRIGQHDLPALSRWNYIAVASMFRRKAWESAGGYVSGLGYEDWDFWLSICERGWRAIHVPRILFFYRVHEGGRFEAASRHDEAMRAELRLRHPALYDAADLAAARAILEDRGVRAPSASRSERGRALLKESRCEEAIVEFHAALDAGDRGVLASLGDCLARLGRVTEADACYREAIASDGNDGIAHRGLGVLALIGRDVPGAISAFERAVAIDPSDPNGLCGMGLARTLEGRLREGASWFVKALDADPCHVPALHELTKAAYETGTFDEAIRLARGYLEYRPADAHMRYALAGLRHASGDASGALDELDRMALFAPDYEGLESLRRAVESAGGATGAAGDPPDGHPAQTVPKEGERAAIPAVSVIVPTLDRPETLHEALHSILRQTFRDFEIVVVNDGGESVDPVIDSLKAGDRIVSIRHEANRGLAAARNTGIRAARGEFIAFLDDDDLYYPDHLETLVGALSEDGCRAAYTDAMRAHVSKDAGGRRVSMMDRPYAYDISPDDLLLQNYFPVNCAMIRRDCLEKAGLFDESLTSHEDWDLWIRVSRETPFRHIPRVTCEFSWWADGGSMTTRGQADMVRTRKAIYEKYASWVAERPDIRAEQERLLENMVRRLEPGPAAEDAASLFHAKRYGEALALYRRMLESGDRSVLSRIGDCHARLGRLDEAERYYADALKENEDDLPAMVGLGVVAHVAGRLDESGSRFMAALRLSPGDSKVLCGLGLVASARGNTEAGLEWYGKALDADPSNLAAIHELTKAAFARGRFAEAEARIRKFLEFEPSNAHMLFSLAGICHKQGKRAEALDALDRLDLFSPGYGGSEQLRAQAGA